jgi:hypothetical protein
METNYSWHDDLRYAQELRQHARQLRHKSAQVRQQAAQRRQEAAERLKELEIKRERAERYFYEALQCLHNPKSVFVQEGNPHAHT